MKQVFSGTDYLGTSSDPRFHKLVQDAISIYGFHYGGSRWANNCPQIYADAEAYLADFYGMEELILFSSGSLAGKFLDKVLQDCKELLFTEDLHPATVPGNGTRHSFLHMDELVQYAGQSIASEVAMLFNTVNPSTVTQLDVNKLKVLPDNKKYILVLDDSHGIGLTGENAKGIIDNLSDLGNHFEILIIASFGKSYGLPGGMIMGQRSRLDQIRSLSTWGGASPPAPFVASLLKSSMPYFFEKSLELKEKLDQFITGIEAIEKFRFIEGFPVFLVLQNGLYEKLLPFGVEISSFPYPDPTGKNIERIVVNGSKDFHSIAWITRLINQVYCT